MALPFASESLLLPHMLALALPRGGGWSVFPLHFRTGAFYKRNTGAI